MFHNTKLSYEITQNEEFKELAKEIFLFLLGENEEEPWMDGQDEDGLRKSAQTAILVSKIFFEELYK
jgi:hypothetical protein